MKEKRVSYKVAKALKKAGYPQTKKYGYREGESLISYPIDGVKFYPAPTYLDVWLWLWREKGMTAYITPTEGQSCGLILWKPKERLYPQFRFDDPEEAIIAAIEYLVNSNLIK